MGVWIETHASCIRNESHIVTPYVGVWIETIQEENNFVELKVTPYVGVWIETSSLTIDLSHPGHTLRGCVDWNSFEGYCFSSFFVTPYVGVWIET